jgi:hypothetical protein
MTDFQFSSPYYCTPASHYAGANPVSILPRQSTSVQVTHPNASTSSWASAKTPSKTTQSEEFAKPFAGSYDVSITPGPEHFHARRKAWLTPASNANQTLREEDLQTWRGDPNSSTNRISELLARKGAVESDVGTAAAQGEMLAKFHLV